MLLGSLGFLFVLRYISPVVQNRWTWAILTVGTSLIMTSGYMFCRIRGMPSSGSNGNWIAAGFQNQFGQEVNVVASLCSSHLPSVIGTSYINHFSDGLLSLSFLMLVIVVPYQTSPSRQRVQVYLWTGVFVVVYSVLVSMFRVKNRG